MLFRKRDLFVRQRTQLINALRAHLAEHGAIAPQGIASLALLAEIVEDHDTGLDLIVVEIARLYLDQIGVLSSRIASLEKALRSEAKRSQSIARLMSMPGMGPITAMAVEAFAHHGDLQKGARFCSLARLGAKTEFERREAGTRPNIEDGTTQHPSASYHWRNDRHSMGMPESSTQELVAGTNAGAQTSNARRDRLASKMARSICVMMTKNEDYKGSVLPAV